MWHRDRRPAPREACDQGLDARRRHEAQATGARTLPVSVADGVASMKVPLAPPLLDTGALRAIDGRSGRPIALR